MLVFAGIKVLKIEVGQLIAWAWAWADVCDTPTPLEFSLLGPVCDFCRWLPPYFVSSLIVLVCRVNMQRAAFGHMEPPIRDPKKGMPA